MSHRIVNNVGYKKIYPMSEGKDDTFCHYCGREARIDLGLQWDHVPALNCAIPEEHKHIKKTLVRACSECNSLASDIPHLDYLERHYWLKSKYLERYKKLLLDDISVEEPQSPGHSFVDGYLNNQKFFYFELLKAVGFGVVNVSQIDSPIIALKCRSGRTVEQVLVDYLFGAPNVIKDEEDDEDNGAVYFEYKDYIAYLKDALKSKGLITEERVQGINSTSNEKIPEFPTRYYQVSWATITRAVMLSAQVDDEEITAKDDDQKDNVVEPVKENEKTGIVITDDVEIGFNRFTTVISKILHEIGMYRELDNHLYLRFLMKQRNLNMKLPKNPVPYFETSWEELNGYIKRKFYQETLNKNNAYQVERIINGEITLTENKKRRISEPPRAENNPFSAKTVNSPPSKQNKNSVEDVMKRFKELRNRYGEF
ncbi:hypothetical protein [Alteromonas lipolytica]|uniref:HNH endonuclease n=1 Tax=Alteromonas lipolytica TaxID=1856405 RepID=A0A1E8FE24_9ALTE|nr:hypothetical protein [Alteromonas lipolytica]OFI34185.1 hypothetical protein BFC17_21855 [Alteromonas lipolytica]GGF84312.1 hypothetical protein GCM10011338_40780 [Alteromonas lipolytica]